MISGIYQIQNITNNKIYIGSAENLKKRKKSHFSSLKKGKHANKHLQYAYNKYGHENFIFSVLEYVFNINDLIQIEQYYIDWMLPEYNICKKAGSLKGFNHSQDSKNKISKAFKNIPLSYEHRNKISVAVTKKYTDIKYHKKMQEVKQGSLNPTSKLNEIQVKEIKKLILLKVASVDIAKQFSISQQTICNIKAGRTWKHVT